MQPESAAHLWDASQAAMAVRGFVSGKSEADFRGDLLLRSAVERQLEILGEALNRLRKNDSETALQVPALDRIIGMRNVIAHEYGEVDEAIVWAAATGRMPGIIDRLAELLDRAGPPSGPAD